MIYSYFIIIKQYLWTQLLKEVGYPKYVIITGRSFCRPRPHRYYTFEEFVDKLYSDPYFKKKLLEI